MAGPSAHSTPEPGAMSECYFLDRLSPEIRCSIYEYVFGPTKHVQRLPERREGLDDVGPPIYDRYWNRQGENSLISTGILAVSEFVHAEALDTLYKSKVIRTTFDGFNSLMYLEGHGDLVRNVEIKDCDRSTNWRGDRDVLIEAVQDAQFLPQLKTFTIMTEYLRPHWEAVATPRLFARAVGLGEVVCTGIGRYRVAGRYNKVTFANTQICQLWRKVVDTPEDYDAYAEVKSIIAEWNIDGDEEEIIAWASHSSFRLWIALIQRCLNRRFRFAAGLPFQGSEEQGKLLSTFQRCSEAAIDHEVMDRLTEPLCHLEEQNNPLHMEGFTEWLVRGMGYFQRSTADADGSPRAPEQIRWAELGNGSDGAEVAQWQKAHAESHFSNPILGGGRWDWDWNIDELRRTWQRSDKIPGLFGGSGEDIIADVTEHDLQRVLHLCLAVRWVDPTPYESPMWESVDAASSDVQMLWLLRKYLTFAEIPQESGLHTASLQILRNTFAFAMSTFSSRNQYIYQMREVTGLQSRHQGSTQDDEVLHGIPAHSEIEQDAGTTGNDTVEGDEDGEPKEDEDDGWERVIFVPFARELPQLIREAQALFESIG
ncbi:unnamed protein product [Zymoseptoria tritici ST99CH_3D7]|uniref:Uncharacterized protein n=3 Tax=Zymoseptoria tritici TaxID=1047171 RepID=F9X5N0_ZYMTI|nr:uncharacterized protein MYCGRDRAFT_91741 [Zymoseptoria tritici IPO323]EGP88823.1 hypothetical protein MYCGRDRAFT_91741 [Zymoseptoria tritici IPO323]SMQ48866.1 unnamed protein product [Zymoseptoria tritici ST99CH_3D7]